MTIMEQQSGWTDFDTIEYQRPDLDVVSDAFRRCRLRLRLSMSAHACQDALTELQTPLLSFLTMAAIARIRHDRKMSDPIWTAEAEFFDEAEAKVENWRQSTYHALLSSRYKDELAELTGEGIFQQALLLHRTVQDRILADLSEENRLESAYTQKIAQITVRVNDQDYSVAELEPLLEDRDALLRRNAHRALQDAFASEQQWLDTCFNQLTSVRHRMSVKLGFDNFCAMGYERMGRKDYGPEQIATFREHVLKYIVPVCGEIRRLQKLRLNQPHLYYWDLPVLLPEGNALPQLDVEKWIGILDDSLGQLLGDGPFLGRLDHLGFLDLKARTDKATGGYCATVYDVGLPFLLTNLTKRANDVMTLIHEAGHAYASLSSLGQMRLYEDHMPGMDLCEIHSTALEFLMAPLLHPIFADQTELHAMIHMTEAILFLPYACLVDHFQHRIYEHPEMSMDARHACWRELERLYQPDLDYADDAYFAKGCAWQKKEHIFTAPFYYIDYALAILASLDLWQTAATDPDKAVRRYKRLCKRGNNGAFLTQLEESGISSPFEETTFKRLVYTVCKYLAL